MLLKINNGFILQFLIILISYKIYFIAQIFYKFNKYIFFS